MALTARSGTDRERNHDVLFVLQLERGYQLQRVASATDKGGVS